MLGNVYLYFFYIRPHGMADAVQGVVQAAGGTIVGKEFSALGGKDFSPVLDRIKSSGADLLMLTLPGRDGFEFIRCPADQRGKGY